MAVFEMAVAGHGVVDWGIVLVFVTVYGGMFLGGLPRLKLNRSGVALLGAIAVIGLGAMLARCCSCRFLAIWPRRWAPWWQAWSCCGRGWSGGHRPVNLCFCQR